MSGRKLALALVVVVVVVCFVVTPRPAPLVAAAADPSPDVALRSGDDKEPARGGPELSKWVATSLRETQTVKPGLTRADLLRVFQEEGGLSTRTAQRYAYRGCPYMKVEVTFEEVGAPRDKFTKSPNDTIAKISKPFLEWSIGD